MSVQSPIAFISCPGSKALTRFRTFPSVTLDPSPGHQPINGLNSCFEIRSAWKLCPGEPLSEGTPLAAQRNAIVTQIGCISAANVILQKSAAFIDSASRHRRKPMELATCRRGVRSTKLINGLSSHLRSPVPQRARAPLIGTLGSHPIPAFLACPAIPR